MTATTKKLLAQAHCSCDGRMHTGTHYPCGNPENGPAHDPDGRVPGEPEVSISNRRAELIRLAADTRYTWRMALGTPSEAQAKVNMDRAAEMLIENEYDERGGR